jgi:cysteine desulfurase / selenocysteine lyase
LGDGQQSGIICFNSEKESAQSIFERLRAAGVICSLREEAVRLSPHIYNTTEECDKVLRTAAGS